MHYKNGRPAQNGDKVLFKPQYGGIPIIGILYDAFPIDDVEAAVFPPKAPPHDAK